jgi:hypothetical protein
MELALQAANTAGLLRATIKFLRHHRLLTAYRPPAFGNKSKRYGASRPVTTGNFSIHHRTARAIPLQAGGVERSPGPQSGSPTNYRSFSPFAGEDFCGIFPNQQGLNVPPLSAGSRVIRSDQMLRPLLFVMAMIGLQGAVKACINDSELPLREREFRSQYLQPKLTTATQPADYRTPFSALHFTGCSMLALSLAAAVWLRPTQNATGPANS